MFEGADGKQTLAELFDGRSQLVVNHFMFGLEWDDGCLHCSFWGDSFDPNVVHLTARDVTFVAVSRGACSKPAACRERIGWSFAWLSSAETDFDSDHGVSSTSEQQATEGVYNYRTQASDPYTVTVNRRPVTEDRPYRPRPRN